MKNIYTILEEIGLTVPENKKQSFDTAVQENYKTVSEYEKAVNARDNFKSQLETANNTISELEKNKGDVENLTNLKKRINKYQKQTI